MGVEAVCHLKVTQSDGEAVTAQWVLAKPPETNSESHHCLLVTPHSKGGYHAANDEGASKVVHDQPERVAAPPEEYPHLADEQDHSKKLVWSVDLASRRSRGSGKLEADVGPQDDGLHVNARRSHGS